MSAPLLQLQGIQLSIGVSQLFSGVDLSIEPGAKMCIVGRNGSGKSTLMKVIAGLMEPDDGKIFIQPGTRITYMPQEPSFPKNSTALEYVESQAGTTHFVAEKFLDLLGIPPSKSLDTLSGGEARRVSLAYALANDPDILMLDEPTNHLDVATIELLEKTIKSFRGSVLLISHDRTFLSNTTTSTLWLDRGVIKRLNKSYKYFEEWAETVIEEETKTQIKMDKLIEQETDWSHGGISARRKRNQGRLKRLYALREKSAQRISSLKLARLSASTGEESGRGIIEARDISKSYDGRVLIDRFTTSITRGDRIGIIGPNGSGKTTLLKMLIGEIKPDSGSIKIGKRFSQTYLDQSRITLDPNKSVKETLCPDGGDFIHVQGQPRHVISYLKEFLFHPDQARSPVRVLSGGEKNRLLLAICLAQQSNFMVLDEPTNDLDMDTLDRLQDMLCAYEGTLLVVSHDRSFLDNVVTSTIVLEGDGTAIEYAGGYSDYLTQRKERRQKAVQQSKKQSPQERKETQDENIPTSPKKLSFKQQYALQELPKKIEKLEEKIKALELALSDPTLYTSDMSKANEIANQLSKAKEEKETLEHEWLEIEILREEIEG